MAALRGETAAELLGTGPAFGIYDPAAPARLTPLAPLTELLHVPIRVVSWYQAWGSAHRDCPLTALEAVARQPRLALITWEPWTHPMELPPGAPPAEQPAYALARLLAGDYDAYLRSWARDLAAWGRPVLLRPLHEMNGDWYPWGGVVNGNRPTEFIQVWHHLRRLFREAGATAVQWVWCPYAVSVPEREDNNLECYFPGAEAVDWLALDGYNWGTSQSWSRWQSFAEIFAAPLARLQRLAPDKPLMLAELGCAEAGGDKAAWLQEALAQIRQAWPHLRLVIWFQIDKECDWRLNSSAAALAAWREHAPACFG